MPTLDLQDLDNGKADLGHIADVALSTGRTATDRNGQTKLTVTGMMAAPKEALAGFEVQVASLAATARATLSDFNDRVSYAADVQVPVAVDSLKAFNVVGVFAAGTAYSTKDVYTDSGIAYVVMVNHVSSTIAEDLLAGNVTVHQGATREGLAAPGGAAGVGYQPQGHLSAPTTVEEKLHELVHSTVVSARPAFIEQHLTGFFGRGMLAAEANNLVTEQYLTAEAGPGDLAISVTDATNFLQGSCVTVKHDNGLYGTYFVASKTGNVLDVIPQLRYSVSAMSKVERTWFNRAHPGKFYMRSLAQRIASATEWQAATPYGSRILYTGFINPESKLEDRLLAVGTASVGYYPASNFGWGDIGTPVRFGCVKTAHVSVSGIGDGVSTQLFKIQRGIECLVKVVFSAAHSAAGFVFEIVNESGAVIHSHMTPGSAGQTALKIQTFGFNSGQAKYVKVRVRCVSGPLADFSLGQIDVFEAPATQGKVINSLGGTIAGVGDSWMAGDLISTAEREPIFKQLALELPDVNFINAGVGGTTIWQQIASFPDSVAPHKPQFVVVNTGTNESYNPASSVFEPNSTEFFAGQYKVLLGMISAIGARPIIIGVPALCQYDEETSGLADWTMNDRARAYGRAFSESLGACPPAFGAESGLKAYLSDLTITAGATPSIAFARKVTLDYAQAETITDLLDGVSGQVVTLVARNGNVTIQHGSLLLHGAKSVELPIHATITLMRHEVDYSAGWVELGRSLPVPIPSSETTLSAVDGVTPNVSGFRYVNLDYSVATVITNFTGGARHQEIQVLVRNGNVTLAHGNMLLAGSTNVTLTANSVITLRRGDPVETAAWHEVSRSIR